MKDEMGGTIITKFVVVRPKRYSVKIQKNEYENKSSEFQNMKGVKKSASKELTFGDFVSYINNLRIITEQSSFRNVDHKVFAVNNKQIAMCNVYKK